MSGSNPNIVLGFQPTPNLGPDFGRTVADAQRMLQIQQQQDLAKKQNALMGIFKDPASLDQTGNPTPETLQKVMSVDPNMGLQLRQNSMIQQDRQLKQKYFMSEMAASNADRLAEAYAPALERRKEAITGGMLPAQADQQLRTDAAQIKEQLGKSGFDPELLKQAPDGSDPGKIELLVQNTKGFRDWQKEQLATQRQKDTEAHNAQMGQQPVTLSNGKTAIFHPGEKDPTKQYTYAGTSTPVSQQDLNNLTKTGTGASGGGSAAGADRKDDSVIADYERTEAHTPEQTEAYNAAIARRKTEADRKAGIAGATTGARQAAGVKPQPVTVDGKPQDALWKGGQWFQTDGVTPITGEVRLAGKPAAAGSPGAERSARFEEMKAAQQKAGTYKDDTSVYRDLDKQMAEDKQTVISDDAALTAAQVALKIGHPPAWMGRSQASLTKFLDTFAAEARRQGLSADEIASNIAKFSGEMAEARTLGTSSARIDFAAKELDVALPQAMAASEKVWRPGFKKVAELQQAIKGQASDPDLLEFAQFNQQVMSAYSAMMNRGGVSTVHAMERAEGLLSTATSQAGYLRQLDTLHKEVQTILYGTQAAKDHLRAEITGSPEITKPPELTGVPRQGAASAAGQIQIPASLADFNKAGKLAQNADGSVFYNKETKKYYDKTGKETAAPGGQTAPTAPLPLRQGMTETDLQDGQVYQTAKGPAKWDSNQKKFFPVGGP